MQDTLGTVAGKWPQRGINMEHLTYSISLQTFLKPPVNSSVNLTLNTHIIVCPQLQTTRADSEDTGEKLIRFKELSDMKILCQVWELFAQISRFLWERKSNCAVIHSDFLPYYYRNLQHKSHIFILVVAGPKAVFRLQIIQKMKSIHLSDVLSQWSEIIALLLK